MMRNRYIGLLVVLSLLMGCASAPKVARMVPEDESLVFESTGASLSVGRITGGKETDALDVSKINAHDLGLALVQAFEQSNLFTEVAAGSPADYELTAEIQLQDQPSMGFSMTVDLAVRYRITNSRTGEGVFNERIASSYQAGVGEAFLGVTRMRKANVALCGRTSKSF